MMRQPRGFTLIELTVATALFLFFIGMASLEVVSVSRLSRRIAHGSAELIAATRMAEHFRDDVHQAKNVFVTDDGDAVSLLRPDGECVEYRLADSRQLQRKVVKSGEITSGPYLQRVHFAVDVHDAQTQRCGVLHARWECFAENDPQQDPSDPARPAPTILILDTALRSEFKYEVDWMKK